MLMSFNKTYLYELGVAIIHIAKSNVFSGGIVCLPHPSDCFNNCGVNSSNKKVNVGRLRLWKNILK